MRLWLLVVVVVLFSLAECGKIPQSGDFSDFVTKYGKKYVNEVEWTYRQNLFNLKVAHVNQHNSKSDRSYEKGINEFSDLTKDEFVEKHTIGSENVEKWITSQLGNLSSIVGRAPQAPATASKQKTKVSVDWSDGQAASPVKNQGECRAGWAFAAVALVETSLFAKHGVSVNLSEQELIDCCSSALAPDVCQVSSGCVGGLPEEGLQYIAQRGISTEKSYPYTGQMGICNQTARGNAANKQLTVEKTAPFTRLSNTQPTLLGAVSQGPIGAYANAASWQDYSGGLYAGNADFTLTGSLTSPAPTPNHMVVVVGYDEDENVKVKNSWGVGWGEGGYMRLHKSIVSGVLSLPFVANLV